MTLDDLNAAPPHIAADALRACGASRRWLTALMAQRPFASHAALLTANDTAWHATGPNDWREAIASHPRIGERSAARDLRSQAWSAREQSAVAAADLALRSALADANRAYEARFGYIFLICATGKSAAELLTSIHERLRHTPETEIAVAGNELRKIARLRIEKLLGATEVACS
ncbi:MAG: 2-oxo-4-hydroxy-4-carboxy-5-ureidoimidazoline decarboxylase [Gemmatimonadaceae bacterium]